MGIEAHDIGIPRNLNGIVAREIGRRIIQGHFQPGDLLPEESELALNFGVSRTVVREAIKTLAAKGLVESRPRRGTMVLHVKFWNWLDPDVLSWQESGRPDYEFLKKLTEVRRIIEPPAAELAAMRASHEDLTAIAEAYERLRKGLEDVDLFIEADIEFHSAILKACQNELIQPVANVIRFAMRASLRVTNPQADRNRASLPFHHEIVQAIQDRNPEAAGEAMRRHLADTWSRISANFEEG